MIERVKDKFRAKIRVDLGDYDSYEEAAKALRQYYESLAGSDPMPDVCPCCGGDIAAKLEEPDWPDWLGEGRY